ncbi:MAG: hypothetical protein IJK46_12890 [Prevotella sp.]|nr:hypothetical protein [Prevotella sp.]
MPKVSGLIVPKLCHRHHDGNNRCLEPVAPSANHHDYGSGEYEEARDKEEPEESLGLDTDGGEKIGQRAALEQTASFYEYS